MSRDSSKENYNPATGNKRQRTAGPKESAMEVDDSSDSDIEILSDDSPQAQQQKDEQMHGYDPDQNLDERRQIRATYRGMIETAEAQRANIAAVTAEDLTAAILKTEKYFKGVRQTHEATLDSHLLIVHAEIATIKARSLRIDKSAFDANDLMNRIKKSLAISNAHDRGNAGSDEEAQGSDDAEDEDNLGVKEKMSRKGEAWTKLGYHALRLNHRVAAVDFMLGPLAFEPKKKAPPKKVDKKAKEAAERAAQAEEKEVTQLQEADIQKDDQETSRMVMKIHKRLTEVMDERETEQIDLFEFMINPDSFSQSVENLFYISFLVKEGKCCIDNRVAGHLGQPMLSACEPPNQEAFAEAEAKGRPIKRHQIFIELDMKMWQDAIEIYDITEPLIPHRAAPAQRTGKWVG